MIREHEQAILAVDLPDEGLRAGDIGVVVMEHGGRGYEVEFFTPDGDTLTVVSVSSDQVYPVSDSDVRPSS